MKSEYGRQSAPGADSWHGECSNEFVVREGSIKSARFVQGRERREAERKRVEKIVGKRSPQLGRKNGRANGNAPQQ